MIIHVKRRILLKELSLYSITMKRRLRMAWLGNAGLKLKCQKNILLVDPFLSRPHWRYLLGGRPLSDEG
jgi:hypothetical protein